MTLSTKSKLSLLSTLPPSITPTLAHNYITYLKEPSLTRSILKLFLNTLNKLDIKISVQLQMNKRSIENKDENKEDINNIRNMIQNRTPLEDEDSNNIRNMIIEYNEIFQILSKNINNIKIDTFLKIFDKEIISSINKNTQYLLFQLTISNPKQILAFLLNKIKNSNNKQLYIAYYGSLVARIKLDKKIEKKAIEYFINITKENNKEKKIKIIMNQTLIYILCFHKEYIKEYKNILNEIFNSRMIESMNTNIVNTFISVSKEYKGKEIKKIEEVLSYFPFDPPIIKEIEEKYRRNYRVFKK